MNTPTLVLLAVAVALAAGMIVLFNRLVRQRNRVREAWSGVDVQLKRRHDLVPNIVTTVKAYAAHEREVLEEVTRVRGGVVPAPTAEFLSVENQFARALGGLLALVEAYPNLRADRRFLALQEDLVTIEDDLQMARRYYNGTVRDFNTMVESFPGNLVAGLFRFEPAEFFEIERVTERAAPVVVVTTGNEPEHT